MIVAIHQPNFFPWLGYFDKIIKSDLFIFLDHVQFPKSAKGVWTNRVKFLIGGNAKWVTAPINRKFHGVKNINEIEFSLENPWRNKMLNTISQNYKKSPYFDRIMPKLDPIILNPENNIAKYNTHAILNIADQLGISREKFYWSSDLPYSGTANEMLVSLTKAVRGTSYMCGGGADGYQVDSFFEASGVSLIYQNFKHPEYGQFNIDPFIPGLSIIDALMNCGFSGVREIINGNDNDYRV